MENQQRTNARTSRTQGGRRQQEDMRIKNDQQDQSPQNGHASMNRDSRILIRRSAPTSSSTSFVDAVKIGASYMLGVGRSSPRNHTSQPEHNEEKIHNKDEISERSIKPEHESNIEYEEESNMDWRHSLGKDETAQMIPQAPQNEWQRRLDELNDRFQEDIERQKLAQKNTEQDFEQYRHYKQQEIRNLEAKLQESRSQSESRKEELDAVILFQQEASLRQMGSARWLPDDEGKVSSDLKKVKMDIKQWSKAAATNDKMFLESLDGKAYDELIRELSKVSLFDRRLPDGLVTSARSPGLLLNSLLAHSVFTSFFESPFFFSHNEEEKSTPSEGSHGKPTEQPILEKIYELAQQANQEDAHKWRSETLRVLMPPTHRNSTPAETSLREQTTEDINRYAKQQHTLFLSSPARHLFPSSTPKSHEEKLQKIYLTTALLAYNLWTRRTSMKCLTLHSPELQDLAFDADSAEFDPDPLVHPDDYEDRLKGRRVMLLVNPVLKVFGTDEARDYERDRVWAKGVVWVDAKGE